MNDTGNAVNALQGRAGPVLETARRELRSFRRSLG